MRMSVLLEGVPVIKMFRSVFGTALVTNELIVHKIEYDSRKVEQNDCFVAIKGSASDGHKFLMDAINRGASAVVVQDDSAIPDPLLMHRHVMKILVSDTRKAMAKMSANFFENPAARMTMAGITGTNGKTTTSNILRSVFEQSGRRCGLIGTIEYVLGARTIPAPHTTPESADLQRYLREMEQAGCTAVSMEVSSHALDQERVYAIGYAAAVFTNLTQDHLDYHGTMDRYLEAKKRLFDTLDASAAAVVNADDPYANRIVEGCKAKVTTYGIDSPADVRISAVKLSLKGSAFDAAWNGRTIRVETPLVGRFNVYNAAAAFAAGVALGLPEDGIVRGIKFCPPVKGRFETFEGRAGWTAIVDYAHTPDALEKCLATIHDVVPAGRGKIITVFGAGGDRDKTKRPIMGTVVERLSDRAIVTSDNPRTEDPAAIADGILAGFSDRANAGCILDRREAIRTALTQAGPGDVVLIAGKGHEEYQVLGTEKVHFSDQELVKEMAG